MADVRRVGDATGLNSGRIVITELPNVTNPLPQDKLQWARDPEVVSTLADQLGLKEMSENLKLLVEQSNVNKRKSSNVEVSNKRQRLPTASDSEELSEGELEPSHGWDEDSEKVDKPKFSEAFVAVKMGAEISETLATDITNACTKEPNEEYVKKLKEKLLTPENTPYLCVPKVNESVWQAKSMNRRLTSQDLALQKSQSALVSGISGVARLADSLKELHLEDPENELLSDLLGQAQDSLFMLGHSSYLLSTQRKKNLEDVFHQEFKAIAGKKQEISDYLFGNDLSKRCKDMSEEHKATAKVFQKPFVRNERKKDFRGASTSKFQDRRFGGNRSNRGQGFRSFPNRYSSNNYTGSYSGKWDSNNYNASRSFPRKNFKPQNKGSKN